MKRNSKYGIVICLAVLIGGSWLSTFNTRAKEEPIEDTKQQSQERNLIQSKMEQKDCYLCGRNQLSLMGYYRKLNSVGVLFLNSWNITDAQAIALDDDGKEIPCDGKSSTIYDFFGEGDGSVVVRSRKERGVSHMQVYLGENNILDLKLASEKLCQRCLNRVTDGFPGLSIEEIEQNHDVFILDFLSGQLYPLKGGSDYVIGDYYIDTSEKDDEVSLIVLYAPERQIKEITMKDFERHK